MQEQQWVPFQPIAPCAFATSSPAAQPVVYYSNYHPYLHPRIAEDAPMYVVLAAAGWRVAEGRC
eukprot:scaffold1130_cov195-Pinguiococcus_pyrenoidosus.AAC.95